MAETIGLTEAAKALQDHFGPRLDAGRDDGRDLMADALVDELGISRSEAKHLVEALERAQSIRWFENERGLGVVPHPSQMTGGSISTEAQSGYGQAPIPIEEGYWQL